MALIHCNFHSDVLGKACSMDVILPQPATTQIGMAGAGGEEPPPVLWLLHGLSDDHTIWQRRTSIERYVAAYGLAVVMPTVDRGYYTDMAAGPDYWTFVSEELPALVPRLFRVSTAREDNFVAGLSMGGYGAFKLALRCPEKFVAGASLSGALDMSQGLGDEVGEFDDEKQRIFGPAAGFRGGDNDLLAAAERLVGSDAGRPALFQCCGTEDFLYDQNQSFRRHAETLGLELTYTEGPGTHEWGYWDRMIQDVLAWLPIRKG